MRLSKKQRLFTKRFFGDFMPWALKWAKREGYEIVVEETLRTAAQARQNAADGVGIVNSNHRKKLACDLQLWKDGQPVWDSGEYTTLGEKWESMSFQTQNQEIRCCWGGRFRRTDGRHFSFLHNGVK